VDIAGTDVSEESIAYTVFLSSVLLLLRTANVVRSLLILITLVMETILSSETSVQQKPNGSTSQKMAFFIFLVTGFIVARS
jgi:hypothetical protein